MNGFADSQGKGDLVHSNIFAWDSEKRNYLVPSGVVDYEWMKWEVIEFKGCIDYWMKGYGFGGTKKGSENQRSWYKYGIGTLKFELFV